MGEIDEELADVESKSRNHSYRPTNESAGSLVRSLLNLIYKAYKAVINVSDIFFNELDFLVKYGKVLNLKNAKSLKGLLHYCILTNDERSLRKLIAIHGVNINIRDGNSATALILAVKKLSFKLVEILLDSGADLYLRDEDDYSAVHYACKLRNLSLLNLLLQKYSLKLDFILSPLHIACLFDQFEAVKFLIECGENIYAKLQNGDTPIRIACDRNKREIVEKFYEVAPTHVLYYSSDLGKEEIIDYCLGQENIKTIINSTISDNKISSSKGKLEDIDTVGTALFMACNKGYTSIVRKLLKAGASPNIVGSNGMSCTYVAAKRGFVDIVKLLIEHKADVNRKNNKGVSPLLIAALEKHSHVIKVLLKANANVNQCDNQGYSPLFVGVRGGCIEIIKSLLVVGVDVYGASINLSPLYAASLSGVYEIVDMLLTHTPLRKGAMVEEYNEAIKSRDASSVIRAVELHRRQLANVSMLAAAMNDFADIVKRFIEEGVAVDTATNEGNTITHLSAINNCVNNIKFLLQIGANLEQVNGQGLSPFYLACEQGHLAAVDLLISSGRVDFNKPNTVGVTPLHTAVYNKQVEVVERLLKGGALVNAKTFSGISVLQIAKEQNNFEIVQMLTNAGAL